MNRRPHNLSPVTRYRYSFWKSVLILEHYTMKTTQKPIYRREILRLQSPVEVVNSCAGVIVKVTVVQNSYWIHSLAICCWNCPWFYSPMILCLYPWKTIGFSLIVKILRFWTIVESKWCSEVSSAVCSSLVSVLWNAVYTVLTCNSKRLDLTGGPLDPTLQWQWHLVSPELSESQRKLG